MEQKEEAKLPLFVVYIIIYTANPEELESKWWQITILMYTKSIEILIAQIQNTDNTNCCENTKEQ